MEPARALGARCYSNRCSLSDRYHADRGLDDMDASKLRRPYRRLWQSRFARMDDEAIFRLVEPSDFFTARNLVFLVGLRGAVLAWRIAVARRTNQLGTGRHLLCNRIIARFAG